MVSNSYSPLSPIERTPGQIGRQATTKLACQVLQPRQPQTVAKGAKWTCAVQNLQSPSVLWANVPVVQQTCQHVQALECFEVEPIRPGAVGEDRHVGQTPRVAFHQALELGGVQLIHARGALAMVGQEPAGG